MRVILYALLAAICVVSASYTEKLTIIPKTSKTTILSFAFKTQLQSFSKNNILLHKHIHQLIDTFDLKKLHLTQTQGRWDYKKNDRLDDLYNNLDAPTGVMLVAWLKDDQNIDKNWKGLVNALSGMFCASLNFLDNLVTVEPKFTKFEPDQKRNYTGYALRYAALPRELVCTENLSPWVKLLPCQTKSGIASIFNPYKLYDSNFHSLSTTIEKLSPKSSSVNTGIVFSQTLTVVTDPSRLQSSRDAGDGWSLSALFEKKITKSCPLAHHSSVVVKKSQTPFDQEFVLDAVADKIADNGDYIFDLSERSDFDLSLKWKEMAVSVFPQSFHLHRYFTGHGQERGGLLVELSNPTSKSMDIILFQMIPWYLKFYMHTLTVECKDQESDVWRVCDGIITKTYYQCAIPRTRPTIIEQLITLPSKTTTRLHVDFDKAFIKYTEHPPDSNRGFDVSAAIVTHGHKKYFSRNLLIHLATPDFSMPYNVITLSCTVLALLAGGMYNLLIRDFKPIVFEKTK